tara:strand:- start:149 stop:745 length:597 start_codon:yes stop_codon:yes gene_type:complete
MARVVKFNIEGSSLESEIVKVDRTKLYGSSKKIVKDSKGNECITSDLYEGSKILPKGSISQVLIDNDGNFVNRSELVGFNHENKKVEKVPSIFSVENSCKKVNIDEFLSVSIKSIYQLNIVESMAGNWKKSFSNNDIYHFIFNYREDYEGDDAYIISNGTDYFITVGKKYDFEYLEQNNIILNDEEEEIEDDLDFSMF